MGYDLHITRAQHWTDSKSKPIRLPEWLAYLGSDPEMRLDNVAVAKVKGKPVLAYENEGLAVWTAWSKHEPDGNMAWFDHRDSEIVVKNPDEEIIAKMKRIAKALKARVIGDEGETY
ncbi:MAG TPA: hypothetical protein VFG68_17250 [Fimbriiglobus sp.]|nr:hypothetical protein [Fimbriiglobus sp.]